MAYGTFDDVKQLLGRIGDGAIGTGKIFTEDEVTDLIDSHSDEINTILRSKGVVLPIDTGGDEGAEFVDYITRLVAHGTGAAVLRGISPEVRGTGGGTAWDFHETRYRDGKKLLTAGLSIPPGLLGGAGENDPDGYFEQNPDEVPVTGANFDDIQFSVDRVF